MPKKPAGECNIRVSARGSREAGAEQHRVRLQKEAIIKSSLNNNINSATKKTKRQRTMADRAVVKVRKNAPRTARKIRINVRVRPRLATRVLIPALIFNIKAKTPARSARSMEALGTGKLARSLHNLRRQRRIPRRPPHKLLRLLLLQPVNSNHKPRQEDTPLQITKKLPRTIVPVSLQSRAVRTSALPIPKITNTASSATPINSEAVCPKRKIEVVFRENLS